MKPLQITDETYAGIPALLEQGMTKTEIANMFGVKLSTLAVLCSRRVISLRKGGLRPGDRLLLTKPLGPGPVVAEGRWISGRRRVFVGEARLIDADGEEAARGTGTFMRSRIALAGLPGYGSAA